MEHTDVSGTFVGPESKKYSCKQNKKHHAQDEVTSKGEGVNGKSHKI